MWKDSKKKRIVSTIIVVILAIAMVLPTIMIAMH